MKRILLFIFLLKTNRPFQRFIATKKILTLYLNKNKCNCQLKKRRFYVENSLKDVPVWGGLFSKIVLLNPI